MGERYRVEIPSKVAGFIALLYSTVRLHTVVRSASSFRRQLPERQVICIRKIKTDNTIVLNLLKCHGPHIGCC